MKIVVPGGAGQIGSVLTRVFRSQGHDVVILSRTRNGDNEIVTWDGKTVGDWAGQIDGADVVVNLAGRSVNCRYSNTNLAQMMADLRAAWGVRVGLPATRWMAEVGAFLLRTDTELVLKSRRVIPKRLLSAGFSFKYPEWSVAASELVARCNDSTMSNG